MRGRELRTSDGPRGGTCRLGTALAIALMIASTIPLPLATAGPTDVVDLLDPDGGEVLVTGQPFRVKWTVSGTGGFIQVGLSTDGGGNYTSVGSVANTGGFSPGFDWRVPYMQDAPTCRMKLVWTETSSPKSAVLDEDESGADFTISRDHWLAFRDIPGVMTHGRYYPVPYELLDPEGEVGSLDLEYRVDEGTGWSAWTSAGTRFTDVDPILSVVYWSPPNYNRTLAQLRIIARDVAGGTVLRTAESTEFEIRTAIVTLLTPNGGEAWVQGSSHTVEWRVVEDPGELINGFGLFFTTDDGAHWNTINSSIEPSYTYDWTVPPGGTSDRARLRVEAYYLEFSVLDRDESDSNFRIIAGTSSPSVTLLDPNPPATGHYVETGTTYDIEWSRTGDPADITEFRVHYSTDGGSTWTGIGNTSSHATSIAWSVPHVETDQGRVRVDMVTTSGTFSSMSNNNFPIYRRGTYNIPPVAEAGPDVTTTSGTGFSLDGTGSFDHNGDPLTYNWTVLNDYGFNVTLSRHETATPFFRAYTGDFNLTIVVQLTVDDGGDFDPTWPFYTDRVSIRVEAAPPSITSFSPHYGWAGTNVTVVGDFQTGATFHLDGALMFTVPTNYTEGDPIEFTLREGLPFGRYPIEVRNLRGSSFSADELDVHPAPTWLNDWGLRDHNPTDEFLTYPWLLWEEGSYKDVFREDQVYAPFYICIGLPWWDPWTGYSCIGYEYEESLFPDPLAALYYGSFFCWIARLGECYGMSCTALELYHNDEAPFRWNGSARFANELSLANDTEFNRHVDMMQGSQLSVEVLEWYMLRFLEGLEPSAEFPLPALGMGLFLRDVENAVRDHEFGVITMATGDIAHSVVPWKVVNIPYDDTVRIYVYDSNKEWWCTEEETAWAFNDTREIVHTPPYIEVTKTGSWWEWSYDFSDTLTVTSTTGLAFIPYSELVGPFTLPTDWDSMTMYLSGDATSSLEDSAGNRNHWRASGDLVLDIPDSVPAPAFMGLGDHLDGWLLANGTDFTTTIEGRPGNGVYNWSVFWNGTSAFAVQEADVADSSEDTITMEYPDGNPLRGRMTYGTTDAAKGYSFTHIKAMGAPGEDPKARQRVYSVLDATLHDDSLAIINTTDDYNSLVFENRGPHTITIGVEFQGNVITEAQLNTTGVPDHIPTARMLNIEVGPYEVVTITPSDWLDLDNSEILVEREVPDAYPPGQPSSLRGISAGGIVKLFWRPPEDDGGSPITEYVLYRGPTVAEMNQYRTVYPSEEPIYDRSVVLGDTYFYALAAVNRAGVGELTPAVGVWVVQGATTSDPPSNLTAAVTEGGVHLEWDPPVFDGGTPVEGYMVYRSEDGSMTTPPLLEDVGMDLEFEDKTVVDDTTYYYWVACRTSWGDSNILGPVEVYVPEGTGGGGSNGGGGGDDDDDGGGEFPLSDVAIGTTLLVVAVSAGIFLGRRFGRKGI